MYGSPPGTASQPAATRDLQCRAGGCTQLLIVLDAAGRYTLNAQYAGDEFYGLSSATALHSVFTRIYKTFLTQVEGIDPPVRNTYR
jgi:hypothetical protein